MVEISISAAVGTLVAFVFLKGYINKTLGQLRHECSSLMTEERELKREREQEEILVESAEARRYQTQYEVEKHTAELEDLADQAKKFEQELGRGHAEGE